jgi:hypothetical protein
VLTNHKHIRQVPVRSASFRVGIPHSPLLPNSHVFPSGPSSSSPYRVGEHCRVTPRTIRFSSSICVHAIWKDNGNRTGSLTPGCFVPFTKSHFPHYRPAQQETAAADCFRTFATTEHMQTHIRSHTLERTSQCGFCPKPLPRSKLTHSAGTSYPILTKSACVAAKERM